METKKVIAENCRTGTFTAISMAVDRLKRNELLSIPDVVKELRDQRMHSVQNDQVCPHTSLHFRMIHQHFTLPE